MKRQTVSLCLIAKDEEATIGMTIKSVLALVDEVIMVDTGSTDNTKIIAEGYGARVLDVAWADDFSAVRNTALNEATCNWVLVLDADEFLQPVRPVEFQRLLHDPGIAGYRLKRQTAGKADDGQSAGLRLFRNVPEVRYRYPIFEQITPALETWARREDKVIADSDLVIMSEGPNQDRRTRLRERNLRILRRALETHPEEPYFPYRLACEGLTLLDDEVLPVSGLNRSLGYLNKAWRRVLSYPIDYRCSLSWLADMGVKVASGLVTLGRVDEALPVIRETQTCFPEDPAVRLQSAVTALRMLQKPLVQLPRSEFEQRAGELEAILLGVLRAQADPDLESAQQRRQTLYPLRYLGELALLRGQVSEAVGHFERALSLDPEYSFAWLGMAECSRFAGDRKRALKLYLRTVTENQLNHQAWLRGCDLMLEMDFQDNAASWWRRVATHFPEHPEVLAGGVDGLDRSPALQNL
jgi:glycosyltransferase involved in cell wall biosynthesis